jgi:hypothetical protein
MPAATGCTLLGAAAPSDQAAGSEGGRLVRAVGELGPPAGSVLPANLYVCLQVYQEAVFSPTSAQTVSCLQ